MDDVEKCMRCLSVVFAQTARREIICQDERRGTVVIEIGKTMIRNKKKMVEGGFG